MVLFSDETTKGVAHNTPSNCDGVDSRRDRSYSEGHALCPQPQFSAPWHGPAQSVIKTKSENAAIDSVKSKTISINSPKSSREHSPSLHKMKSPRRPRSKSESENVHHHHLRSPIYKKKYHGHHHQHHISHASHYHTNNSSSHRISPVTSPKFQSLGKMWIRPVPIRQSVNDTSSGKSGKNGVASSCESDMALNHIPFLPSLFGSKQVAPSTSLNIHDKNTSAMSPSTNSSELRQVSETSSSSPSSPPSISFPLNPVLDGVDGATNVFSPLSNMFSNLYSSPNSSFDSYPRGQPHHRKVPSPYHDPSSLSPTSAAKPMASVAFGESGKPITAFKQCTTFHHQSTI